MSDTHKTTTSSSVSEKVQATARFCAANRAYDTVREDALIHDEFAEHLAGDAAMQRIHKFGKDNVVARIPVRTFWFDKFVEETIAHMVGKTSDELMQVVLLGAGMDMRAFRMECLKHCIVYEVDDGDVLELKQELIHSMEKTPRKLCKQVRNVPRCLSHTNWDAGLKQAGYKASRPSLWILEGLMYYLTNDQAVQMLQTVRSLMCEGSRLALDHMTRPMPEQANSLFIGNMQDPYASLGDVGFATDCVHVYGGPHANFGKCPRKDIVDEFAWQTSAKSLHIMVQATVPVAS